MFYSGILFSFVILTTLPHQPLAYLYRQSNATHNKSKEVVTNFPFPLKTNTTKRQAQQKPFRCLFDHENVTVFKKECSEDEQPHVAFLVCYKLVISDLGYQMCPISTKFNIVVSKFFWFESESCKWLNFQYSLAKIVLFQLDLPSTSIKLLTTTQPAKSVLKPHIKCLILLFCTHSSSISRPYS